MSLIFLASRNPKKLEELRRVLTAVPVAVEVIGPDDVEPYPEPAETEPTFEGNALIKARAAVAATGLPSLADDSGLCIDALNGMPGVLSARWAGTGKDDVANTTLVLEQLTDVPDDRRGAEFRCAIALCLPDGREEMTVGAVRGSIIRERRGSGGFGYDPIFVAEGHTATSAELTPQDKDRISHRGQALRAMAPLVTAAVTDSGRATRSGSGMCGR